jgi:ATP-binding cassette subfamily C (CFTR/MRP) protein 1
MTSSDDGDTFCNGPYYDYDLTWNTTNPNLTQCFRDTALIGTPAGVLWIMGIAWAGYHLLRKSPGTSPNMRVSLSKPEKHTNLFFEHFSGDSKHKKKRKISVLFLLKSFFTCLLIFNAIYELIWRLTNLDVLHSSDLFHPICLLVASVTSALLLVFDKYWTAHTSPPQFFFYVTLALGTAPTFKVQVEELVEHDSLDWELIVRTSTLFPVATVLMILNCWADLDQKPSPKETPQASSSVLSLIFFGWLDSFMYKGFKTILPLIDLPPPPSSLDVPKCTGEFLSRWSTYLQKVGVSFKQNSGKKNTANIWSVIFKKYSLWYGTVLFFLSVSYTIQYIGPQMLKLLINHVDSDEETWKGFLYIGVMFASQLLKTLIWTHCIQEINNMSLQMRSNVLDLIFRKSLQLSNNSRKTFTVGEVTNYMAVDAQRIVTTLPYSHHIWSSPFQVSNKLQFDRFFSYFLTVSNRWYWRCTFSTWSWE